MPPNSASQAEASDSDPPEPSGESIDLPGTIVRRLGKALADASARIERAMKGESVFADNGDRQNTLAILRQLSELLPLLEKYPAPLDPGIRFIPPCPVCYASAGKHWAHECPRLVTSIMSR